MALMRLIKLLGRYVAAIFPYHIIKYAFIMFCVILSVYYEEIHATHTLNIKREIRLKRGYQLTNILYSPSCIYPHPTHGRSMSGNQQTNKKNITKLITISLCFVNDRFIETIHRLNQRSIGIITTRWAFHFTTQLLIRLNEPNNICNYHHIS